MVFTKDRKANYIFYRKIPENIGDLSEPQCLRGFREVGLLSLANLAEN